MTWLVLVPLVIIIAGALASLSPDLAPAIGGVALVAGIFAILKGYLYKEESNWECPDCHEKFNFDFRD
jgi:hypothetical protein